VNKNIFPDSVRLAIDNFDNMQREYLEAKDKRETIAAKLRRINTGSDAWQNTASLQRELSEKDSRIESYEQEIPTHRAKIRDLRGQASLEIINQARQNYENIVSEVRATAIAFGEALELEKQFVDGLESDGVAIGSLKRASFPRIGLISDQQSPLTFFLKEIERNYPSFKGNENGSNNSRTTLRKPN
jgi:vacuolar-type H+-ATPase subunit I/STV1